MALTRWERRGSQGTSAERANEDDLAAPAHVVPIYRTRRFVGMLAFLFALSALFYIHEFVGIFSRWKVAAGSLLMAAPFAFARSTRHVAVGIALGGLAYVAFFTWLLAQSVPF